MNEVTRVFGEFFDQALMGIGGTALVNIVVLFVLGRVFAVEKLNFWNSFMITVCGYGALLAANAVQLNVPVLLGMTPMVASLGVTLACMMILLDLDITQTLVLFAIYCGVFLAGASMGLLDPSTSLAPELLK